MDSFLDELNCQMWKEREFHMEKWVHYVRNNISMHRNQKCGEIKLLQRGDSKGNTSKVQKYELSVNYARSPQP